MLYEGQAVSEPFQSVLFQVDQISNHLVLLVEQDALLLELEKEENENHQRINALIIWTKRTWQCNHQ